MPVLRLGIPGNRLHAEGFQNRIVDEARFRAEQCEHQIADDDDRDQVRQQDDRLVKLLHLLARDLVQDDRDCDRNCDHNRDHPERDHEQEDEAVLPDGHPAAVPDLDHRRQLSGVRTAQLGNGLRQQYGSESLRHGADFLVYRAEVLA